MEMETNKKNPKRGSRVEARTWSQVVVSGGENHLTLLKSKPRVKQGGKEIKCQLWKWVYENRDDVAEEHVSYCDDDDGSNPRLSRVEELQLLLASEDSELETTHVPNWTIGRLNDCWRLDDWRIDFPSINWSWLDFVVRLLRMIWKTFFNPLFFFQSNSKK